MDVIIFIQMSIIINNNSHLLSTIDSNPVFTIIRKVCVEENFSAFVVGGFVRDLLIGRQNKDVDILVIGEGIKLAQITAKVLGIKKVNFFKNFGTANFRFKDYEYEFVGARKESYSRNSRKPIVENGTFSDDIKRRDFTINTLAISLNDENFGEILDEFNGIEHIEKRIILTPLDPEITFDDDPLRIMRAIRFASVLNFKLDESISIASKKLKNRLEIVSQERITDEFLKILNSDKPSIGLKLLQRTEVMQVIFPEIYNLSGVDQRNDYHHKDVFLHTCQVVDKISIETKDTWLRFAALVHDIAKPLTKNFVEGIGWTFHTHEEVGARMMKTIFARMKLPFNKLDYVEKLIRLHLRPAALVEEDVTDSAIRRLIVQAGEELDDLITLCRADITSKNPEKVSKILSNYDDLILKIRSVEENDKLRAFQSPVRGEEIMKICNIKPSKKVGEIKAAIEEAILDGVIPNEYSAAIEYLHRIKDNILQF